jgi:hypothetical protein
VVTTAVLEGGGVEGGRWGEGEEEREKKRERERVLIMNVYLGRTTLNMHIYRCT